MPALRAALQGTSPGTWDTQPCTGYLLYAYGTTNTAHRSGGEASRAGARQTTGSAALALKRSVGSKQTLTAITTALAGPFSPTTMTGLRPPTLAKRPTIFIPLRILKSATRSSSIRAIPDLPPRVAKGAFASETVRKYYGGPVPIDASCDHLTGVIDPERGQGAFGYEYYGEIPRFRWTM